MRVIWLDREAAREAIRQGALRLLAERPEVQRVLLFGSLARGDAVPGSDADVLIVADTDIAFLDRAEVYEPYFDQAHLPANLFVYTPAELARLAERPGPVRSALREGIVLSERTAS